MKSKKIYKIFLVIFIVIIIAACVVILLKKNKANKTEVESIETVKEIKEKDEDVKLIGEDRLDEVDGYYYECVVQNDNIYNLKENATREEKEKIYKYHSDEKSMLYELCRKNTDLSLIPCNKDLEALGFGNGKIKDFDYDYDSIERIDNEKPNNGNSYILVKTKNDNIERTYRITYGWSDGSFNNIYIKEEEEKDINSSKILKENLVLFDNEHIKANFEELCLDGDKRIVYPQEEWDGTYHGDNIAVSDNFRDKYPYFLDLFIHYSPLEYNEITLKDLDIEKQVATFEIDSLLECKKRIYEVKYKLTDNLYLDDAEVNKINEMETEATLNNINGDFVFYKNTNWLKYKNVINYTDNFYNKFSTKGTYFSEIDEIDVNAFKFQEPYYKYINAFDDELGGGICFYMNKFDEKKYYFEKFVYINNYELDDIICKKLPYDSSLSIEEVKEKFLEDKELQKELGINFE